MESHSTHQLDLIVTEFNRAYAEWSSKTSCGANFRFSYNPATGAKILEVTDTAALDPNMPKDRVDPRVISAEDILKDALEGVVDGSGKP
ncbi:MAG: hypothetical protein EBU84_14460 [Actinobacteria bacterium]|nr:hypothetical protein [Actinomycetota bacterium]